MALFYSKYCSFGIYDRLDYFLSHFGSFAKLLDILNEVCSCPYFFRQGRKHTAISWMRFEGGVLFSVLVFSFSGV